MNAQERLDQLIASFDTAMLVTTSLRGQPRARPMAIAGHVEGGLLYFATRAEDDSGPSRQGTPRMRAGVVIFTGARRLCFKQSGIFHP